MAVNPNSPIPQLPMSKVIPAAIVGLVVLAGVGGVVGNWVMDIMDSSFRTTGRYASMLEVTAPPAVHPKSTYVCTPNQTKPWIGCSIQ